MEKSLTRHPLTDQPLAWMSRLSPAIHEADHGVNPLVDHAGRVFEWLATASHHPEKNNTAILYLQAQSLLQSARENYKTLTYPKDVIISAHFCLCATLDELVFRLHHEPIAYSLLDFFHREKNGEEKFFHLLDHVIRDPKPYHDLIELMYCCMMLGFKGHYQHSVFAIHQHRKLCSDIYRLIQQHKGDTSSTLSPHLLTPLKKTVKKSIRLSQYAWLFFVTILIIAILGFAFEFAFTHVTDTLLSSGEPSSHETVRH